MSLVWFVQQNAVWWSTVEHTFNPFYPTTTCTSPQNRGYPDVVFAWYSN